MIIQEGFKGENTTQWFGICQGFCAWSPDSKLFYRN